MPKFKKCPRCEINYILEEQEYCEICQQELKGISIAEDNDDEVESEICPRCRVNFLCDGETICESCAAERELKEKSVIDDVEPDWVVPEEEVVDDEDLVDDEVDLSLDELADEEATDEDEDEPVVEEFFIDIVDDLLDDDEEFEDVEDTESES